jgi:hypothetical protein
VAQTTNITKLKLSGGNDEIKNFQKEGVSSGGKMLQFKMLLHLFPLKAQFTSDIDSAYFLAAKNIINIRTRK